jgi:hypothetical protein
MEMDLAKIKCNFTTNAFPLLRSRFYIATNSKRFCVVVSKPTYPKTAALYKYK